MTIKTVFFDVGNTLLTPAIPEEKVLCDAAACLGATLDIAVVSERIPAMYEYYEELFARDNSIWADDRRAAETWMSMYEYLCDMVGIPEVGPQVARLGYETFLDPNSWTTFDDVIPTLLALKARQLPLGLISNWDNSLESIIDGLGLRPYFGVVLSSAVVGLHKPQLEIFELAMRRMGATKEESMYVGDHIDADIKGAANAGMKPVLIDRDNNYRDSEEYIRIQDMQELLRYL